jgi:ferritin-like metal-binding protein YciE
MNIDTFRQIYGSELQELYSVETQLTEALPKMLDTARRVELKQVLRNHLQETRSLNWRTARASTRTGQVEPPLP